MKGTCFILMSDFSSKLIDIKGDMAHQYRELLAYVGDEKGNVSVEIITLTRNGLSYYFQNKRWRRAGQMLFNDVCTAETGDTLKISPLSRHSPPNWVILKEVVVSSSAKERFENWKQGNTLTSS